MKSLSFTKMHGLGNDFMMLDCTAVPFTLAAKEIKSLGEREIGVGFDQLLVVEPASEDNIDFNYRIFNRDGNEVEHCGNGARCFAKFVHDKGLTDKETLTVQIQKGTIQIIYIDDNHIQVDMGEAITLPANIPFVPTKQAGKQYQFTVNEIEYFGFVVSMGNPHVVFFVEDVTNFALEDFGKAIQQLNNFPQSVNVNVGQIVDKQTILIRTYERGVGETKACGTGMCATMFAANQLDLVGHKVTLQAKGGETVIDYHDGKILMTGPARTIFEGQVSSQFWGS